VIGLGFWVKVKIKVGVMVRVGVREMHFYGLRSGKLLQPENSIHCGYATHAHFNLNCMADVMQA